jgi:hypothetical protein
MIRPLVLGLWVWAISMVAIALALKHYYPSIRGRIGERWVARQLDRLDKSEYFPVHDLTPI